MSDHALKHKQEMRQTIKEVVKTQIDHRREAFDIIVNDMAESIIAGAEGRPKVLVDMVTDAVLSEFVSRVKQRVCELRSP